MVRKGDLVLKKTLLSLFILASIALTGCANTEQGLTINKDKSVDFTYKVTLNKNFISKNATDEEVAEVLKDLEKDYEKKDFSFKKIEKNEVDGFVVTKHYNSISDISKEKSEDFPYDVKIKEKNLFFLSTYDNSISIPKESVAGEFSRTVEQSLLNEGKYSFFIKTPYKVKNSNADDKSTKNLIWELSSTKDTNVEFSYNHYNAINIIITVGIILITLFSFILIRRKK